uniref:Peroxidase n=1 Tax=Anthurium amnicola TaxID=1678845 RepID=A0A1D1XLE8_9ARAE
MHLNILLTARTLLRAREEMASTLAFALLVLTLPTTPNALKKACLGGAGGELSWSLQINVYQSSCPMAEDIIFSGVQRAVADDPRMAASLLRLHFHDCFVNGCDASVLLDDTPVMVGEKTAGPNLNSLRGFEVVDGIKSELEMACPQTVSCADILAVAARDSVALSGGPTWDVELGRKDSLTASKSGPNNNIPGPNSDVKTLVDRFNNVGLSLKDMVALSGGHTIGNARCATFSSRLKGFSGAGQPSFLDSLQQLCSGGNSTSTLAQLDLVTPATFDGQYYANLLGGVGLLASDQALVAGDDDGVRGLVETYAEDTAAFFEDFRASMLSMGRLKPPAGMGGEVRRSCRVVN